MSPTVITIKRNNHRIHLCETHRKQELLKHLIELYSNMSILIISSSNKTTTEVKDKNITLSHDSLLAAEGERQWDVLISFDVPTDPELYITRLTHAKTYSLIIADDKEQSLLYPIESHLGRSIVREIVEGFEPTSAALKIPEPKKKVKSVVVKVDHKIPIEDRRPASGQRFKDKKEGKKPWDKAKKSGEAPSVENKEGTKKPWIVEKDPSERKPWDLHQNSRDKKPADQKPTDIKSTPSTDDETKPKREPRIITVKPKKPEKPKAPELFKLPKEAED